MHPVFMCFFMEAVTQFDRSKIDAPGPCVLFATPGMLSGGLSLEVFKHWAPAEANMIVLPGYSILAFLCLYQCNV